MDLTEIGAVISFVAEAVARQALTAEAFPRRRSTAPVEHEAIAYVSIACVK